MSVRFHPDLEPLMVDITTISQHPDNPNNGDIEAIEESIRVNGFISPLIVQASTGKIVAGNHRYAALLKMGATQAPVVSVDIDDAHAMRYLIADNQIARLARTDAAAELELLRQLMDTDLGLAGTGHDEFTMEALLLDQARSDDSEFMAAAFNTDPTVYQVVVEFDSEQDAIDLEAELADRELDVRRVNL